LITAINFYYWKLMWHVHVAIFKWLRCVLVLLLNPNLNSIVSLSSHCYCETHEHHYICHSQKKLHSLTSFVFLTITVKVTSTVKKLSLSQHLLKINKSFTNILTLIVKQKNLTPITLITTFLLSHMFRDHTQQKTLYCV
jgi:hypothetical protein